MRKFYKSGFLVAAVLLFCFSLSAQNNFFTDAGENTSLTTTGKRVNTPLAYRAAVMDAQQMKDFLWSLPAEETVRYNHNQAPVMELPMPDGKMARFHVWESSIMEPGLAAKFPEMKTFAGQGIDDPYATIRFDYNPYFGFSAQVLSPVSGRIFIDPYARWDINNYMSFYSRDSRSPVPFICETPANPIVPSVVTAGPCRGTQLYTYRLALACTGEYAIAVCAPNPATTPVTAAAMLIAVNRVTGVYESEVSIRMQLVSNNNLLIFLDPASDPYTNNNGGAMLSQNIATCNSIIGSANYDIGHVFSTGGGGVAFLSCVCTANKAGGVTGLPNPVGDGFYIDYVAHEMGHQFGGNHTFNSVTSNCGGGNRNGSTAYEVGSGTTIQAYAGICGADNIQPNSDPFFHTVSFDEISNYAAGTGGTCALMTATGNTLPAITAMNNNGANIPLNTPFTLTGSATDADNDPLTYCWEEWDLGPGGAWNGGASSTTAPLFKSRIPKTSGSRTFPDIAVILAGYPANPPATMGGLKGETLPLVARAIKFRLTVRDNRAGGGGVVTGGDGCQGGFTGIFQINTIAGTGPFVVNVPNGGESWPGGSSQTVTWNPAGSDAAPINCAFVKISLSIDGGLTYPTVISASTANDGSESITVPSVITSTARIKIEAVGNIFFDISNANFSITAPVSGFTFIQPPPEMSSCPAGPSMTINLGTIATGGFNTPIVLTATGNPVPTTVSFSPNPLTPGGTTVVTLTGTNLLSFGSYTITVTGTAGPVVQNVNLTYTINAGVTPVINTHPSSQSVCQGNPVSFIVAATGALTYQWQKSIDGGANWSNISGATSTTYTIGSSQVSDAGQYRCVVSGQCGSVNSNAAILTVNIPPAVTSQPQNATLCAGSNNTFTITATGTGIGYQWQLSTNGCSGPWSDIPGANAASYTLTGITAGQNNTGYRCVVTGACSPPATSNCALLTVVTSVTITTQPTDQTVCEGSNASFTVAGSGPGVIYQWQISTDGGINFNDIPGATTATYTITGVSFAMNNNRYRALLSNATCSTPGISNAARLTVNTLPLITTGPSDATICVGGSNTFSVSASGTAITYQWQLSIDGGANYTNIGGANSSSYTVSGAVIGMNGYRYRSVVSGTCAPQATSSAAILTVIAPVAITAQPANSEICSGSNTSFSVTGTSIPTIIYQWQVSTDNGVNWTNVNNGGFYSGATTATLSITGATTSLSTYRYRAQLSSVTCSTPTSSNGAILTVRQLPTIGLTAAPLTSLLPGQLTTLTATPSPSTGGVLTISWFFNTNPLPVIGNTYVVNVEHVGTYQVTIQEAWPSSLVCSNQSANVVIDVTVSDKLFIFPSPNDGRFTVSYFNNGGNSTQRQIVIFDSKGAKVYDRKFPISGPYTLLNIDLRAASRGIYYVLVGDASGKKLADGKVHVR